MFLFSTVRRKMHFFICLQCPSCLFVSYLSGLTNSIEWFTVLWMYPYLAKFEYAFQRSLTMVEPGSIHSWICFNKVFSLRSSTVTIKHFLESSSMPPKTHWPSTTCSRWYFFFSILDSSICTTFPGPPSFWRFSNSVTSQSSRQNMSQSTAVWWRRPSYCLICHCSNSWLHQYVNLITSSIDRFECSNELPSLMLLSILCLFRPICLLHSQT